ncbi:hypothetical protein TTHERM_00102760 (macronuclear) [Tetrahymena thermophila SB210]|uniref:Uncharacterized protein n=1 Tax=Tetrahymena thermophila (strain SB210) TaxID=312017 RepID=Q234M2_TETTS|nr:hypothetical protein TTHERM_00102760 [Tetrahymena thermophila SB210]EAR91981.2 hypothetical protein TTHERM_00102760 [Tetrahymena thermophila SB210]|eukprot:XP_001012226.2 hypothetical protein TTHERM_00102760 [Tetrahymena thermophila SB210]
MISRSKSIYQLIIYHQKYKKFNQINYRFFEQIYQVKLLLIQMEIEDIRDYEELENFEKVEEIPLQDELFEIQKIVDISKILSVKRLKHSKVLIMKKYYFQIPNYFEQENLDGEATFMNQEGKDELDIIENGDGTAQIVRIDQLYKVLTFFNVEIQIQAEVYRQHFNLKPIYTQEVRQLCHYREIINCIKECTKGYIQEQFENNNLQNKNQIEIRNKICDILFKQTQIHQDIFDIQFKNKDLDLFEKMIINNQIDQITSNQIRQFKIWRQFNSLPITTVNKCFCEKYQSRSQLSASQVQEILDRVQNQLFFNKDNDLSNYIQCEEVYFNISQRTRDFKFSNKIYLKVGQKDGNPFFFTKDNSEQFIGNLFTKYLNSLNCVSIEIDDNQNLFNETVKIVKEQKTCQLFLFQIKDFLMNVDYKILDLLGFNRLARYLKQRTIYYYDPITKLETKINNKNGTKGIFFGEVFASDVCLIVCQVISSFIEKDPTLQKIDFQIKVLFNYSSFLIKLTPKNNQNLVTQSEDIPKPQFFMKLVSEILHSFGFEEQKSSVRYYSCDQNKNIILQKLDEKDQFIEASDFYFYRQDLIKTNENYKEFSTEQINYLKHLLNDSEIIKENDLLNSPQQQIIHYINLRLIKRYIKKGNGNLLDKEDLNLLYKHIYQFVELPFFVNKIPFLN